VQAVHKLNRLVSDILTNLKNKKNLWQKFHQPEDFFLVGSFKTFVFIFSLATLFSASGDADFDGMLQSRTPSSPLDSTNTPTCPSGSTTLVSMLALIVCITTLQGSANDPQGYNQTVCFCGSISHINFLWIFFSTSKKTSSVTPIDHICKNAFQSLTDCHANWVRSLFFQKKNQNYAISRILRRHRLLHHV